MAFDFAAGLSSMGQSVAQTAGLLALEEQRSANARELQALASQLAGERESASDTRRHASAMELQASKQAFEEPEVKARTGHILSQTALAEEEAGRKRALIAQSGGSVGDSYDKAIRAAEGGVDEKGNPIANKLGSGAFGPYQIMPGTWNDIRAKNADLNLPEDMTKATLDQHKAAFDRFTAKNAEALQRAGVEATPANLYLAHRFGAAGAEKVIKAAGDTPLSNVLPPEWQSQNPDMQGKTAADFRRFAEEKMKGVSLERGAPTKDDMPADYRRAIENMRQYDPKLALEAETRFREKRMEIDARSRETDKAIEARREEHEKTITADLRKAQKIVPMEDGMMGVIDIDGKLKPIVGADGQPYKGFVDKERQAGLIQSLSAYNKQADEVTRAFAVEMREAQKRLTDATNPLNATTNPGAAKAAEAYIADIKADFDKRIGEINGQQDRLINELMGKTKAKSGKGGDVDPAQFRRDRARFTPLLNGPL